MQETYHVKTPVFEGPLDLLLQLIEKRKLFISDISLANVADDFISHARSQEHFPVKDTAHFLLISATLVLIKSKSLLPTLSLTEEEQSDIEDLERRLHIYKRIRAAGRDLGSRFGRCTIFFKAPTRMREPVFSPDRYTDVESIHSSITRLVSNLPKEEKEPEAVMKKVVSLEEMMNQLTSRVQKSLQTSFREFSGTRADKGHTIISFLAILELVKQGIIDVAQDRQYEDITLESKEIGTPRYE